MDLVGFSVLDSFDQAEIDDCAYWHDRTGAERQVEQVTIPVIGLDDLKANKRASGRTKDLLDLENLP